jgi:hypothetical protein
MAAQNFLSRQKLVKLQDHTAAGTSELTTAIIDTAGYQGVVIFTSVSTANATNSMKIQQNTANQTTGMADLTGTSIASGSSDEDLIVELHKPLERYIQAVITRGASTTCESVWACLYNGPATIAGNSVSGTQIAEVHSFPVEGTA